MAQTFQVTRSVEISASPEEVFPYLNDLHLWQQWSPWEEVDPDLRRCYSDPANGVGATYAWEGNRKAGKGEMEITHSEVGRVSLDLRFEKPFRADNQVAFTLAPTAVGTLVTWTMTGTRGRVMALVNKVADFDAMIGRDFEKGLGRLKRAVETRL
ncbi:SRPBCC family protein [Kytococcus schroeteri]|uniref:Transcriptional regulator n=1 Tax=Kytococcus schroeteri TaxID=138300 RepID=A0A2I1PB43_9MICO|nr:SRPBCC family protein [Kytococcus schroeteri]PKZ41801.1 transcriptional regulator [Kytococcus schroeteri]